MNKGRAKKRSDDALKGMAAFLNSQHIRVFDYARFAEPLRERIHRRLVACSNDAYIEKLLGLQAIG